MRRALVLSLVLAISAFGCGKLIVDDPAGLPSEDASVPSDGGRDGVAPTELDAAEPDASSDGDAGYELPFAMTFEQGIVGRSGANAPTLASANTKTPLFGSISAQVEAGHVTSITRTFPAQGVVFVSFYVRIDAGSGGGELFRLDGTNGTIVNVRAEAPTRGRTAFKLTAAVTGGAILVGEVTPGTRFRIGVKSVENGNGNAIEVSAGAPDGSLVAKGYAQTTPSTPSSVVLGNLDATSAGLTLSFDDVYGRADAFAPASK